MMRRIGRIVAAALGVSLCLGFWLSSAGLSQDHLAMATGPGGAVATVDADATRVGLEVLRRGGNAIDAAVAAAATLGVTDPFSAGISGGGFMVIYLKDQDRLITLDGREQAPAATTVDLFQDPMNPGDLLPFCDINLESPDGKNSANRFSASSPTHFTHLSISCCKSGPNFSGYSIAAFIVTTATGFRSLANTFSPYRTASNGMLPPPANASGTVGVRVP